MTPIEVENRVETPNLPWVVDGRALAGELAVPYVELINDLVAAQDNVVCERVHLGVSSRAFDHGVLTAKDEYVVHFTQHYLASRGQYPDGVGPQ